MSQSKPNFKCILIGDSGVGKSCLMMRFAEDTFNHEFVSTIGVDFTNRTMELDGERVKCQLWDTAGQERFRTLTTSYYRDAQGVVIVYDVSDRQSFDNVNSWKADVQRYASADVAMLILGNKADLGEHRAVTFAEGGALAAEGGAGTPEVLFYETSAKDSYNVEEAFMALASVIKDRGLIRETGGGGRAAGSSSVVGTAGGAPGSRLGGGEGSPGSGDRGSIRLAGEATVGQDTDTCSGCGGGRAGAGGGGGEAQSDVVMRPAPVGAGAGEGSGAGDVSESISEAAAAVSSKARGLLSSWRTSAGRQEGEGEGAEAGGGNMQSMAVGQGRPNVTLPGVRGSTGGPRYEYSTVDGGDGEGESELEGGGGGGGGGGDQSAAQAQQIGGGGRLSSLEDER